MIATKRSDSFFLHKSCVDFVVYGMTSRCHETDSMLPNENQYRFIKVRQHFL